MSIERMQSSQLMQIFNAADKKQHKLQEKLNNISKRTSEQISMISNLQNYLSHRLSILSQSPENANKLVLADTTLEIDGNYEIFGMTMHPHLAHTPENIFNFRTSLGYVYKNNVKVQINNKDAVDFIKYLKADNMRKPLMEFNQDTIEIELSIKDNEQLGDNIFNCIEIDPILSSSFDIMSLDIYNSQSAQMPEQHLLHIEDVPKCRFFLSEKSRFGKIVMSIKLKCHNDNGKYLFGFNHLYFLYTEQEESYAIIKYQQDKNIKYLFDNIIIHDQFGQNQTLTADELGISFFQEYNNGNLSRQVEPSAITAPQLLSSAINKLYVRLPIKTSIVSLTLNLESNI